MKKKKKKHKCKGKKLNKQTFLLKRKKKWLPSKVWEAQILYIIMYSSS